MARRKRPIPENEFLFQERIRASDLAPSGTDITGRRQIYIRDINQPHPDDSGYFPQSTDPKPPRHVREGTIDPAAANRVPISGRSPRLEPPLNRPLNQPSGPPEHDYNDPSGRVWGWDGLGATAAPPRYVDSDPGAAEIGRVSRQDVADGIKEAREEISTRRMPVDPESLARTRGTVLPTSPWPHGHRFLEAGVPGTGIFSGFISAGTTGEFNPDMFGWSGMRIYEQMRRTDADVACALFAMKLPLYSVIPEIVAGESEGSGDGNLAKEMAEFAERCFFDGLERENPVIPGTWVTQPFNEVKENAFLMLDFGCAAHENLWRIDGDKIVPRFLAPRLPWTFYRFWMSEDGETLTGLEQLGYRRERYISTTVPANNVCMFVNRKEGSNWYGLSSLRSAYQHWYLKSNMYRIDSIALERNGMGIPWIKFPPGAKTEDVTNAQAWVEQMAVSERTGLSLPDGYTFEIAGLRGRIRDPINSIRHHSQEIVRSVMAMFIALGTTETGSRALANTLLDFFRQSLQHYANVFSAAFNNFTIKPLMDLNYRSRNGHRLPYPKLVFPSIVVIDPIETADVLAKLGASQVDIIRSSEPLEKKVLQFLGLPYGPARTKFAPTYTQVRVMAQPAGAATVPQIEKGEVPIEEQHPLVAPAGSEPIPAEAGAGLGKGDPYDNFMVRGSGLDVHDTVNEIVHGRHGTGVLERGKPAPTERPPHYKHLSDMPDELDFQGITVLIENQAGTLREGENRDGTPWQNQMTHPYGYIKGVIGLDQEELDCFVGPYKRARNAYVVKTRVPETGEGSEEKILLGFRGAQEAKNVFLRNYDSPDHFRSIKSIPMPRFKEWMAKSGGRVRLVESVGMNGHSKSEIGIDLDGTLAESLSPFDPEKVGEPIPEAVEKVKRLKKMGYRVYIFTARKELKPVIEWALGHHIDLPVTNRKRAGFVAIIDNLKLIPAKAGVEETIKQVKEQE